MRKSPQRSRRPLALLAAFALLLALAACGSTTSPSPSAAGVSPGGLATSPATSPSASPASAPPASASASASDGAGLDLDDAATALDDLEAYQLEMEVAGVLPVASGAGAVVIEALFDRANDAVDFSVTGASGLPGGAGTLRTIVIGDDAWLDPGTGVFLAQPGGSATYSRLVEQLSPETLLRTVPTGDLAGSQRIGEEERNGIPVVHYLAEGGSSPQMADQFGADSVMHLWVSTERGHLVALEMQGRTDVNGVDTDIVMSFDISRINDPTIDIQPPN